VEVSRSLRSVRLASGHPLTFFDERGRADPAARLATARQVEKPGTPVAVICRTGNRIRAVSLFMNQ